MTTIPANANVFDLAYRLDPSDPDKCEQIDPLLAPKLKSIEELKTIYFHLCYGHLYDSLPATKTKVEEILCDYLEEDNLDWNFLQKFINWLSKDLRTKLVDKWLTVDKIDPRSVWVGSFIPSDHKECIRVLDIYLGMYKANRSQDNLKLIEALFNNIGEDKLEDACKILSKGTPAISALLLSRENVPDDFTITGLKALSKLSKRKNINVKMDFNMLKHLGPRSRLDAMKHLLGIIGNCYSKNTELPFTSIPKREDVEFFLFPCSIKYNTEVVELVEHFDKLTSQRR